MTNEEMFLYLIGISYGNLVHFVGVWYFFPILIYCTNLATLTKKAKNRCPETEKVASDES
jgi:uncharacterized membrane protein YiaA